MQQPGHDQRPTKRRRTGQDQQQDQQTAAAAADSGAAAEASAAAPQQAAAAASTAPAAPPTEADGAAANSGKHNDELRHILYVRWFGGQGQTKLNKLPLRHLDTLEALEDLPRELVESQFPAGERPLPPWFTAASYTRFTPEVECLALPGDVVRTELRLVLVYRGWEYTVLRQDTTFRDPGPEQTIQLMTAEFMGSDPLMAALGLRISLIAYPVVGLRKVFLEELHERLVASPETFKGKL